MTSMYSGHSKLYTDSIISVLPLWIFFLAFMDPYVNIIRLTDVVRDLGSCELELVFVYIVCGGLSVLLVPSSQLVISSVSALLNTACSQGLAECC